MAQQQVEEHAQGHTPAQDRRVWEKDGKEMVRVPAGEFLFSDNKQNEKGMTPVGEYSPQGNSPYGCVDMAGDIWEWTASDDGDGSKMLCGGGWSHPAAYLRVVPRSPHHPDDRFDTDGFRCVV